MNVERDSSSQAAPSAESDAIDDWGIRIHRGALVLPSGCTMPPKCVLTNQPVSESDMVFTNLTWTPASVGLWALLGSPALIFGFFVGRELCSITYGLSRSTRIRKVMYAILKVVTSIGLLAATVALAVIPSVHWTITLLLYSTFILFLGSIVLIFIGNSPLRVVDYRNGMFWVKGFSQEYLDDLDV